MAVLEALDEDESYLWAILADESGLDLAEFTWKDDNNDDGCWRAWPFQWMWYRTRDKLQIDQCARSLGKSVSIQLRGFIFAFTNPGQEMLITAPELVHLQPVTQAIETRIMSIRLSREMLDRKNRGTGFTHQPFGAQFANGARILGRIPQRDGKGVKGSVAEGTLILTDHGLVPVEYVSPDMRVVTQSGRFKRVLGHASYEADCVTISGAGHRGLTVSANHRFWGSRNLCPKKARQLTEFGWKISDSLESNTYLASPTVLPPVDQPDHPFEDLVAAAWVAGRYVADGNMGTRRIVLTVHDDKLLTVLVRCSAAGLNASVQPHENPSVNKVEVFGTWLREWLLANFGEHADGKYIPYWMYVAEEPVRRAFLEGYLSGDGSYDKLKRRWVAGSASKELAMGIYLLGQTLGYNASFSWVDPKVTSIRGRLLKSDPKRSWRVTLSEAGRALRFGDYIWKKVRKVSDAGVQTVYDLFVEDDYSYISEGLVSLGSRFQGDR